MSRTIGERKKMKRKLLLLDLDTQVDFFLPEGSRYMSQARMVRANIWRLFELAQKIRIPVISTVLRVRPGELSFMEAAPFCVEGTEGESKLPGTILPRYINLGLRNITDLPCDIFKRYQQVIIEQRLTDIFTHVRLERLVTEAFPATFVVCGASITKGVLKAALGLRHRGLDVVLVTDAVLDLEDELTEIAYRRMEAKGVVFCLTEELGLSKRYQPADYSRTQEGQKQLIYA